VRGAAVNGAAPGIRGCVHQNRVLAPEQGKAAAISAVLEFEFARSGGTADLIPGHDDAGGSSRAYYELIKITGSPVGSADGMGRTVANGAGVNARPGVKGRGDA